MEKRTKLIVRIATVFMTAFYALSILVFPFIQHGVPIEDSPFNDMNWYYASLTKFLQLGVATGALTFFVIPIFLMLLSALLVGVLGNKGSYVMTVISAGCTTIHAIYSMIAISTVFGWLDITRLFAYSDGVVDKLSIGFWLAMFAAIVSVVLGVVGLRVNDKPAVSSGPATRPTPGPAGAAPRPVAGPQAAAHSILCVSGEFVNASFPVNPNETVVIGRDSSVSNIVIVAPKISRKHCTIRFNAATNMFEVVDCSSNGTFQQNGTRLIANMMTPLPSGTVLSLGSNENQFRLI